MASFPRDQHMNTFHPRPFARFLATAIAIGGTLLSHDLGALGLAWTTVIVLTFLSGVWRNHFQVLYTTVLPIALVMIVVWGWIVGAPPSTPIGSDPHEGVLYALFFATRLAVLIGIFQLCFLSIPSGQILAITRRCHLPGDAAVILLGALALVPELRLRTEQVLTARYARGLVPTRGSWNAFRQLPHLLRPLLAWVLRSAVQRAETWQQRQLIQRLGRLGNECAVESRGASIFYLVITTLWLAYNLAA